MHVLIRSTQARTVPTSCISVYSAPTYGEPRSIRWFRKPTSRIGRSHFSPHVPSTRLVTKRLCPSRDGKVISRIGLIMFRPTPWTLSHGPQASPRLPGEPAFLLRRTQPPCILSWRQNRRLHLITFRTVG